MIIDFFPAFLKQSIESCINALPIPWFRFEYLTYKDHTEGKKAT